MGSTSVVFSKLQMVLQKMKLSRIQAALRRIVVEAVLSLRAKAPLSWSLTIPFPGCILRLSTSSSSEQSHGPQVLRQAVPTTQSNTKNELVQALSRTDILSYRLAHGCYVKQ